MFHSIKLDGKKNADEFSEKLMTGSYQLVWGPTKISHYLTYGKIIKSFTGSDLNLSMWVGMMSPNTMVTKILPGSVPEFIYFRCYSIITWILILITILLISIIHLFKLRVTSSNRIANSAKQQAKILMEIMINHISPLLSRSLERDQAVKSSRLSLSVYLLFSMVISIKFCTYLLDNLQWELPVIKINTLEDLAQRKNIKIIVRHDSSFVTFVDQGDSELTRSIQKQLEPYFDFDEDDIENKLVKGLMEGSVAYFQEHLTVVQILFDLKTRNKTFSMDNLHISTGSAGDQPYFILYNPEIPIWASLALDRM